jgi:hypothetical protein
VLADGALAAALCGRTRQRGKAHHDGTASASFGSADTDRGADLRSPDGAGGRATPVPGADGRNPAVVPWRLSGALRRRADRRQCRAAMSAAQSGEPVAALPNRRQRNRGRGRAQPALHCLPGWTATFVVGPDGSARTGGDDASCLRRRFPRVMSRRAPGGRQGTGVPGRPPGEPLAALPGGDGGGTRPVGGVDSGRTVRRRRDRAPPQPVGYCSAR